MNKTILHFSQDFSNGKPQLGGYGRILNLTKDGNKHIIFTTSQNNEIKFIKNVNNNITIIQLPLSIKKGSLFQKIKDVNIVSNQIFYYLNKYDLKFDLLFGHSQIINFFILLKLKKKYFNKIKIIWEFNAIWSAIDVKGIKNKLVKLLFIFFENRIVKLADILVVQTEKSAKEIKRKFNVKNKSIVIIPNAIDKELVDEKSYNKNNNRNYLILINGLFDEMNGLSFLYNFFKNNKLLSGFEFHFYGKGPFEKKIEGISDNKNIFYHGAVSREKMIEKLKTFDFILIPRLNSSEAKLFTPSKLIEAMAFGLVPIVSNVGGMNELVNNSNGFVLKSAKDKDLNDVLIAIKNIDKNKLKKMSTESKKLILENYTWFQNHQKLDDIYQSLVSC